MADAYWSYGDARYQTFATAASPAPGPVKRPRTDYVEISGAQQFIGYPREEKRVVQRAVRESETLGASYDQYLRNGQVPLFGTVESARAGPREMHRHPIEALRVSGVRAADGRTVGYEGVRASDGRAVKYDGDRASDGQIVGYEGVRASDGQIVGYEGVRASDGRRVGYESVRMEKPLPPDASSTLFVEGLPADCTRREVSHIFRPFPGFLEVRLVNKESRHPGGEPWVLCFADFSSPSQAAIALESLEGYRFDEHDRCSLSLRIEFSRFPGPRSSGGRSRGGRH